MQYAHHSDQCSAEGGPHQQRPIGSGGETASLGSVGFERAGSTAKMARNETGPLGARKQPIEHWLVGSVVIWPGRGVRTASVAERATSGCSGFRLAAVQGVVEGARG